MILKVIGDIETGSLDLSKSFPVLIVLVSIALQLPTVSCTPLC